MVGIIVTIVKEESFKRMKIVSNDTFWKYSSAKAMQASFEIAYLIALAKNLTI